MICTGFEEEVLEDFGLIFTLYDQGYKGDN
jgi:hypothetical protein